MALSNTSFALLDGWPIHRMQLFMPFSGAWRADIEALVNDADITGTVSLILADQTFTGTVFRGGVSRSIWTGRVVGGNGKLPTMLSPKYYKGATALLSFQDAISEAGEVISSTTDLSALNALFPSWTRTSKTLGQELTAISGQLDLPWRVLRDGTIWIGTDPGVVFLGDYLDLDFFPETSKLWIIPSDLGLFPGMKIQDHIIDSVLHVVEPDKFYTEVTLRDG